MKKNVLKGFLLVIFFLPLFFYSGKFQVSQSAPSTNLKDQLSSAQLSYFGRLSVGNTIGNSIIIISTTTNTAPSPNNYNLFIGDTIAIANSAIGNSGSTQYTVRDIAGTNSITLTSGIGNSNAAIGSYVIATRSATHTVSFSPSDSITGGKWQVLVKATNISGENPSDGMPDQGGFDLGTLVSGAITCPWGGTASIGTTTLTTANVSVGSTGLYNVITCALPVGGTNSIGAGFTGTFVIGLGNSMFINPAPAPNHTVGQANASADTYSVILRHLDAGSNVIDNDTTVGKNALTESVQISAIVDPTLTFSIGNSGVTTATTNICGTAIGNGAPSTTATNVSFGSLNLSAFNNLAQFLQCTTNSLNGYVIQAFESNPLTMVGGSSTIPDTTCPSHTCSSTSDGAWDSNTASGFGYSLQVGSTSAGAVLGITTAGNYKSFGNGYSGAQTIISRPNTPTSTDSLYVCYRITASNFQPAGTYQNEVNYIATATF